MIYHGYHPTPLEVGRGGMPKDSHAEDMPAQSAGGDTHV